MSLDVYLTGDVPQKLTPGSGIFVRKAGATIEITREEWDRLHPGEEPVKFMGGEEETNIVYSRNITHNLGRMAGAADIYKALWRPEDIAIERASQLIAPLSDGLMRLRDNPDKFRAYNPENGWGNYEGLVAFVADYLAACKQHPDALVSVSR